MRPLSSALLVLAVLYASLVALPAAAQNDGGNPYEGRVGVADQSAASRDQGLREALAQVVGRVSGVDALGSAAPVLGRAAQYVQQYGFTQEPGGALQLVARFDKTAVDAQLRALGLPVWGYASAPAEELKLSVSGLRGSADYARVLSTLRAVPGVKAVAVQGAEADRLQLGVRAEGGSARLAAALAGGRVLVADGAAPLAAGTLNLRLAR
ncbi:DUF2066 domain-containing protein [Solimonas soli]|uniref:DUF2066 domain-containing protein n=1 Tax=Solimonas soli TaxID=413479 RepID=UPI0004897785|nr:DUF2066 domain-containing protein [Solimonas soli]